MPIAGPAEELCFVSTSHTTFAVADAVATLTFTRPEARNAMTWTMYDDLVAACDTVDGDETIRVLVLRGVDDQAFIAGTDISQFTSLKTRDDAIAYETRIDEVVGRLEAVTVPTIARVQGPAVGGGFMIAVACDMRLCGPDARLGIPVARTLGNCLSAANCARLLALVGPARVKDLMYTGRLLDADEALRLGVATRVVPAEELDQLVSETAATLANNAPLTLQATKELVRRLERSGRDSPELAYDLITQCYTSHDFQQAVRSFVAKQRPRWTGH